MKYFEAHDISEYRDANRNVPEILIVDGNRSAGKTTAFSRKFVDDFIRTEKKFMLVYRYKNELINISESFFKDIKGLFFPNYTMTEKNRAHGSYVELFLDGKSCGYAVALNISGKLKHYSHIFSDVGQMFFDEYQLENGYYLVNEIEKFISLHMTVARGQGEVVRFVPVYMCSNSISIFNPYYEAFGIANRINSKTKVLKGNGFVLLRLVLKEVSKAQEKSAFNRAFSSFNYMSSAVDNSFLNDENYNIIKLKDTSGYFPQFAFVCDGNTYIVYSNGEKMHAKKAQDPQGLTVYGAKMSDRGNGINSIRNSYFYLNIRKYYMDGKITFQDPTTKKAFIDLLFTF